MSDEEKVYCDKCGKYFTQKRFESHYKKCVSKFCLYCGKQLLNKHKRIMFCSRVCASSNMIIEIKPRVCINCGLEYFSKDNKSKFCCRRCAAVYNNSGKSMNPETRKKISETLKRKSMGKVTPIIYCSTCGKPVKKKKSILNKSKTNLFYCNTTCHTLSKTNDSIPWEDTSKQTKINRLLKEQNNKCAICGIDSWNNCAIVLRFDHIDGNNKNNEKENCRLICANCDSQLPTFSGRNKRPKYSDEILLDSLVRNDFINYRVIRELGAATGKSLYKRLNELKRT